MRFLVVGVRMAQLRRRLLLLRVVSFGAQATPTSLLVAQLLLVGGARRVGGRSGGGRVVGVLGFRVCDG